MLQINAKTMREAYKELATQLTQKGDDLGETLELRNVTFQIENPLDILTTNKQATNYGMPIGYTVAELLWYLNGDNSVDFIGRFANMWPKLTDDGKTNNSAYGYIINSKFGFNQLYSVVSELRKNPNSRRATIKINTPHYIGSNELNLTDTKDEPCTLSLQFMIRNSKLEMSVVMRSNDIWFGTPNDVVYFSVLQQLIAKKLDIKVGTYTHTANSFHVYKRNLDEVTAVATRNLDLVPIIMLNTDALFEKYEELYNTVKLTITGTDVKQNLKDITQLALDNDLFILY